MVEKVGWHPQQDNLSERALGSMFLALGEWKTSSDGVSKRGETCSVVDLHFEGAAISCRENLQDGEN